MRALCPGPSQTSQTSLLGHSQGAPRATGRHQARTCMLAPRKPESGAGQHVPRSCSPLQQTAQNFSGFFGTRRNSRAVASPSPATLPSALRTSTAGQALLRCSERAPGILTRPPPRPLQERPQKEQARGSEDKRAPPRGDVSLAWPRACRRAHSRRGKEVRHEPRAACPWLPRAPAGGG